jgi:hypothetical protein
MKQQHPTALNHRNEKGQFLKGIAPANKGNLTGMRFGNLLVICEVGLATKDKLIPVE